MAKGPSAQDDARENRMVDIFNLDRAPEEERQRHGTDAFLEIDGHILEFELKSVTREKGSISTVRDFGPDHIAKWQHKHWIIGFFVGAKLIDCRYGSPDAMRPWIEEKWDYIKNDFEIAKIAPDLVTVDSMYKVIGKKRSYSYEDAKKLQKNQYSKKEYEARMDLENGFSAERMLFLFKDRIKYVIERGATLNNPHISYSFFATWPLIDKNHAATLRRHIRKWIAQH